MIVPHLYLKGNCEAAISQYVRAFGAEVKMLIPYPDQKGVMHAEVYIHGQRIMLNDYGWNNDYEKRDTGGLGVVFKDVAELKNAYEILEEGSRTLHPMEATDYSPCVV